MATTQPRISVVAERALYDAIATMAERDGMSMSQKARDLLLHAVELEEDEALEALVLERMKNKAPSIPAAKFWADRAKRRKPRAG